MVVKKKGPSLVDRLSADLVRDGLVTEEQFTQAQEKTVDTSQSLGKTLVELGLISEDKLMAFVARQLELPDIDLANYVINTELVDQVPEYIARKYKIIPLYKAHDTLTVAMANPVDVFAIDELQLQLGISIKPALASEESIDSALDEYYGGAYIISRTAGVISQSDLGFEISEEIPASMLERITEQPPIVKLVNEIILEAIKQNASDIHLEPESSYVCVRYRIDGILHKISTIPKHLKLPVVSRIKIMAGLDIAEKRLPQDGRIRVKSDAKEVDLRISTFPTINGEKIMLRVLDTDSSTFDLTKLGLSTENLLRLHKMISNSGGMVYVCGPTGCGKTTTLYALINTFNRNEKNIITLEDPVEYDFEGISQGQIYPKKGLTFASGLRTVLRQDPDIIMVGEVRDKETAELAVRASLTGHLVLSTIHTTDAVRALTRLIDMNIEPYLLISSLNGILSQRLVRRLCEYCRKEYEPSREVLSSLGLSTKTSAKAKLYKASGCSKCRKTGFSGRVGIFETLVINENIRNLITANASIDAIRKEAVKSGFKPMLDDGIEKIIDGLTTIKEVFRETMTEE